MHFIKQGKTDVINADPGLKIPGQSLGYLPADPVLSELRIDENIKGKDQEQQREKEPLQYFLKSLQLQRFKQG